MVVGEFWLIIGDYMTKKCNFCTEPCGFSHCVTNDNIPTYNEYSYTEDYINDSVYDIDAILKENELLKEKVAHLEQLLLSVTEHLVMPTPEKDISHEELWKSLDDDLEYLSQEESEEIIRKSIAEADLASASPEELEAFFKRVNDAIEEKE